MKRVLLVLFVLLIGVAPGIWAQVLAIQPELATIGIQANWPITIKTMEKKARVYINRGANFTEIPKFLQDLRYTLHHRERMITVSCRVKTSGLIYLCLFADKTPKSIGLHQNWEKCGTMQGPSFKGKNNWTIYQTYVKVGDILAFPRDDEMGLTVIAKEITKDKTRPLPKIPETKNAKKYIAGKSVENRAIEYLVFGEGNDVVFILATIHGDEYVGTPLVHRLAEYLDKHPRLLDGRKVVLLPNANPDGMAHFDHFNVNGVDLNRNFDSSNRRNGGRAGRRALSEPEACAIQKIIEKYSPNRVVSIHQLRSWASSSDKPSGMVDYEGPAEALAEQISYHCKLPAEKFGTQHGSLGAYVGNDLGVPIITLELTKFDYGLTLEQLWGKYGNALITAVVYPDKVKKINLATLDIHPKLPSVKDSNEACKHVIVYKEPGRFCGWPATHGIWCWGNEILVGFRLGYYKVKGKGLHNIDPDMPTQAVKARSLDGGVTWKLERPEAFLLGPSFISNIIQPQCPVRIEFTHPDFAMAGHSSFFYFSYNRGKSWRGPYTLSTSQKGIYTMGAVNNYIVNDKHDCFAFITFNRNTKNRRVGQQPICIRTTDGGKTWHLVSWMAPKTTGHSIMPSTVRCSQNRLVSAIRRKERKKRGGFSFFIEIYRSNNNGKTWEFLSRVGSTGKANGNPPSMIRLKDGRIVVTYGYRAKPYGIRAKISLDEGKTWEQEIHLRDDGLSADLGYPRTVQRPDGKIVTVYYFTTKEIPEQHIAATIWDPDKISSRQN